MLDPTLEAFERDLLLTEEELAKSDTADLSDFSDLAKLILQYVAQLAGIDKLDSLLRTQLDRDWQTPRRWCRLGSGG
jgi:hypothetical protein